MKNIKNNKYFRSLNIGFLIAFAFYIAYPILILEGRSTFLYIFIAFNQVGILYYLYYQLKNGHQTPQNFGKNIIILYTIPYSIFFSYFSSTLEDKFFISYLLILSGFIPLVELPVKKYFILLIYLFFSIFSVIFGLYNENKILMENIINIISINSFFFLLIYFQNYRFTEVSTLTRTLLIKSRTDKRKIIEERAKSEKLLLNILPKDIAEELKEKGRSKPQSIKSASIIFTDFKGFTQISEKLSPEELVKELDLCFSYFDSVTEKYGLEKLKTIGDSYMCAGGIPIENDSHALDCCLAAIEIQNFMNEMKSIKEMQGFPYWELRLGITQISNQT